jgi:hypothetical protein
MGVAYCMSNLISHPLSDKKIISRVLVKNLVEEFFRIALNKDYGHCHRAILCLSRRDFPHNRDQLIKGSLDKESSWKWHDSASSLSLVVMAEV